MWRPGLSGPSLRGALATKQSRALRGTTLDCFASLAMTEQEAWASRTIQISDTPSPPRGASARVLLSASRLLRRKGRREGRVPADTRKTPVRRHCTRNARGRYRAADHPAFPARCLTAYGALSPETSVLFASVTSRIDGARCPIGLGTPPQGLAVATTARTTRFGRTLQRRSSARGRISRGFSRPAPACRARRCRVHRSPIRGS